MKLFLTAAIVAALGAGTAGAQTYSGYPTYGDGYADGQRVVRCESVDSRRNFCRVDTRGGVQLVRQHSRNACVRGRDWQATRDGITVTDGCRADFLVGAAYANTSGYTTDRYGRRVYSSTGYPGYTTDRYGNRVYTGSSYPYSDGAYTTDRYGRRVYDDRYSQTGYGNGGGTFHCEGTGYGRTYCGERGQYYTLVARSPSCQLNRTYGEDAYGTWISGACNADFAAQPKGFASRSGNDPYYGPSNTGYSSGVYTPGTDPYYGDGTVASTTIRCNATSNGRTYCGDRNRSYTIRTGSSRYCVEGQTYGRDSYGLWVTGACNLILEPGAYDRY